MAIKKKNAAAAALGRLGGLAKTSKPKGFAAMSPAKRRAISKRGGKAKAAAMKANQTTKIAQKKVAQSGPMRAELA